LTTICALGTLLVPGAQAWRQPRVTTVAGLKATLARLDRVKVQKIPRAIYKRDGYSRRYDRMTAYRVTPSQRRLLLAGDKTVEDFISPEFRFPDSWLYTSLEVERDSDVYLLLDRRLPLKLLHIVRRLAARGLDADAFYIISGHRTERVNGHIHRFRKRTFGRSSVARRSLHLVGRAMDLIIGDLDRNGRIDAGDHRAMVCAIRAVERRHPRLGGGLGLYAKSVHTDVRGGARRPTWCGKGGNKGPLCRRPLRCRR
jgi:hypothetical protein